MGCLFLPKIASGVKKAYYILTLSMFCPFPLYCFPQRVLQNSFTDGVANPCDAESIKTYIVKNEGALSGHPGATYLLSQKFEFNWTVIGNMDKVNYRRTPNLISRFRNRKLDRC